ncbi:hypothetical protein LTS10_002813 [Elasticomyces elasticus]|nr:hypothetical protein LTS10_002813 [Elasticomyces elasticus]
MGQAQSRGATGDHFYTLDSKGELAPWSGYEREDLDCFVYSSEHPNTVPVYRWYKSGPNVQDHFYTTDSAGELAPAGGYVPEGIAFYLFRDHQPDTVALNRWYHPQIGDHFYTTHPTGELAPAGGYVREGITGYVLTSQIRGSVQLYRWYHSRKFNFTFDQGISVDQAHTIWERHTWAYYRAGKCTHLAQEEKDKVRSIYERDTIHHGIENTPGVHASAAVGGRFVNVNFKVLFPKGDNEIAMSLLHEMMHCAGYEHRFPKSDPRYFQTVPLKAERCIAGFASDIASPAIHIAREEMDPDGSLIRPPHALTADEAEASSGCRLLDISTVDAKNGTPLATATASSSGVDVSSHDDAVAASTLATDPAGGIDARPYEQDVDMSVAVGLTALSWKK